MELTSVGTLLYKEVVIASTGIKGTVIGFRKRLNVLHIAVDIPSKDDEPCWYTLQDLENVQV